MIPTVPLNSGIPIPQLGLGVFQVSEDETQSVVEAALEAGYRSIDTAALYRNERGVGLAIEASGLPRDEVFVTTKLWATELGPRRPLAAIDASLERLGLDHVDLYLIHWPAPATDAYLEAWQALEAIAASGRARTIGVSNFLAGNIKRIVSLGGQVPAVNQVELHPGFRNRGVEEANTQYGIATEAWSPLGQGTVLGNPALTEIAEAHGKSPAQIVIRWHLQQGRIVIPKSVTPARIKENIEVFDFELDAEELARIDALDQDQRIGPDPARFNP